MRRLKIAETDSAMPGFLTIALEGGHQGQGYSRDASDPLDNKIYFYEVDGDVLVHYVGKVLTHDPSENRTAVRGKLRRIGIDGTPVVLADGEDDWTANRPTA